MNNPPIHPAIYLIDTLDSAMLDAFREQSAGVPAVTFDLEITGLSPIDHQVSLIGLGVPAKSGFQCCGSSMFRRKLNWQRHSKNFGRGSNTRLDIT